MKFTEFISLHRDRIHHYNRLQFLGVICLQFVFPFLTIINYASNGERTFNKLNLFYYFATDTNNLVIPSIFLIFLILTMYFYFTKSETKYFDLLPLTLTPILSYSIFSWLNTLVQPKTLPRTEMYIELGLMIIGVSIIAFYAIYFINMKLESVTNNVSEKDEFQANTLSLHLEERLIVFLICFSLLPIVVTIPALGIFATHFISTEDFTFFTAYGIPLTLPESYIYYRVSTIVGEIIYNPIFFALISLILFCTSIFAIRSISERSTIKKAEILFVGMTLIFLFLIDAFFLSLSFYLFFSWLIIPYLMIYDSKKNPKLTIKGVSLFIIIWGIGIIIIFMQVLVPIDFGLMTGIYGLDQVKIRPTFILLTLPYLINRIYHGYSRRGEKLGENLQEDEMNRIKEE